MSSSVWIPGLLVLVLGLAAGLWAARRLRGAGRRALAEDLELEIADLEARKEDLYRRLRGLPGEVHESGERDALERAAARTLQKLDRARDALAEAGATERGKKKKKRKRKIDPAAAAAAPAPAEREPPPAPPPARRPAIAAFVAGAVTMGLLAGLVYWAGRDATPRPDEMGSGAPQNELPPDHPPIDGELPAEASQRLAALEARLASDPEDIMARKELALTLLGAASYVDAFEQAEEILARIPEDPDGLFVQGVVRLAMGRNDEAVELLDRVLARFPEHRQAMLYRGLALYQGGKVEQAIDTWELGIELAGGSQPELEQLIRMAREQGPPPPAADAEPVVAPPAAAEPLPRTASPAAPAGASTGYPVHIELGAAVPPPRAALFVFLRPAAGGPPVAVRRIDGPRFPLDLVLGPEDSMMGQELPEEGVLVARLDADGSVSTRQPGDLAAEAAARRGTALELVLTEE